jgi:hypothetical protein
MFLSPFHACLSDHPRLISIHTFSYAHRSAVNKCLSVRVRLPQAIRRTSPTRSVQSSVTAYPVIRGLDDVPRSQTRRTGCTDSWTTYEAYVKRTRRLNSEYVAHKHTPHTMRHDARGTITIRNSDVAYDIHRGRKTWGYRWNLEFLRLGKMLKLHPIIDQE